MGRIFDGLRRLLALPVAVGRGHRRTSRSAGLIAGRGTRSVAVRVFLWQLIVVLLLVASAVAVLALQGRQSVTGQARAEVLAVARTFAGSADVVRSVQGRNPTAKLQPLAEQARKNNGVDYVVVYDTKGIRLAHPEPRRIGHRVSSPYYREVLAGKTVTQTINGTRGRAVNASVPVRGTDGSVLAAVSVGIPVARINQAVSRQLMILALAAAVALALSVTATALVARRLNRETHGLGPAEITRVYEHHNAVLHAAREGVLIIGGDARLLLANDESRRLLGLPDDVEGRLVRELGLPAGTASLLTSGREADDELQPAGDKLLSVNARPTAPHGGPPGTVVTLRDTTELQTLSGNVAAARLRLQQLYDAGMHIGTTLDVTRTAEELANVAVPDFADFATVDLAVSVLWGDEPMKGQTPMRRTAVAGVRSDHPLFPPGTPTTFIPSVAQGWTAMGRQLVEGILDERAVWEAKDPERTQKILSFGIHSVITVQLRARGTFLGVVNFWRSEREEVFEEDDVSFAEELVARAAVSLDNARRFTREHALAVALQRSLLPRTLPRLNALEVSHRYLPAQSGAGGDWFDVIPLPGTRTALVVGDVVGHGLHATATMGRLRTAIHNFSSLDLAPDELLSRLDKLVAEIDQDRAAPPTWHETHRQSIDHAHTDMNSPDTDAREATVLRDAVDGGDIAGATCLYAIYDQVTGVLTVAKAGHPSPALVHPEGTVEFLDVPAAPPLGVGGLLPFESAEFLLPEGSSLVLFTDGLVQRRGRDIDAGLELLRASLSKAGRSPAQMCNDVFDALLPRRPADDIALLVSRVRRLDPARVAQWEVPRHPAAVAPARRKVTSQMELWGLQEEIFTAEVILSELITNAVRYGNEPLHIRVLYDPPTLVFEVADASSSAPHLRYAATTEEGGRGLFLVAQLATRWGTRYTPSHKVVWAEINAGKPPDPDAFLAMTPEI